MRERLPFLLLGRFPRTLPPDLLLTLHAVLEVLAVVALIEPEQRDGLRAIVEVENEARLADNLWITRYNQKLWMRAKESRVAYPSV